MKRSEKKREKSVMHSSKVSIKESVMGACTNLMYKLGTFGGIKVTSKQPINQTQKIVILGSHISNLIQAQKRFKEILWFTYRSNLKITQDIHSDVGWGCLPRVGQMVLAQAIIKHLREQGVKVEKNMILEIIGHFVEGEESQYSLSNILKYARWKFNLNPGQWFNIGQISEVLRKIQDEAPLKGTQNLKIAFFSQSVIFKSKLVEKAGHFHCNCGAENPFFCQICHYGDDFIQKQTIKQEQQQQPYQQAQSVEKIIRTQQPLRTMSSSSENGETLNPIYSEEIKLPQQHKKTHKLNTQIILIVSVRVGEKKVSETESKIIRELLQIPTSIGAMGGVPSKALYLVGFENEKLVYLDPHFVQQFVGKEDMEDNFRTYFCQDYRSISSKSLDPSMAFCYYLKTIEDAEQLINKIEEIKKQYKDETFISIMDDDNFSEQLKAYKYSMSENSAQQKASMQYNSLEFRDIEESY